MSLNNKFAKYGIVLVAAITVATAAQSSSQAIATQRVYAEEVTNVNYSDSRMFYAYSAQYPDEPNSGGMAGRVVTPSSPYVVGENFYEAGTYDHYDVFDDTGKHYNVGDVITVDDPLVNHPNEEDNRLYYYYYPLNPNTSEAPAPSTSPSTSEAPAPSTSPSTSEAPAPSTSPSTSEAPAPSTSPSTSEAPAVEKPSQKADDKTTATDKAKADKKADSKPAKTEKSKDANSKKAAATKDNSVANKAAEKSNATSAPTEQAKDTTAKTNNPDTGNSQSIVKEAAGTVDTAAVNHNDSNGFLATLLVSVAAALIGLFQYKKQPKKEK